MYWGESVSFSSFLRSVAMKTRKEAISLSQLLPQIFFVIYYKGVVRYNGVEYDGIHESLVTEEKWEKVQTVPASHINGERTMRHPHFLKSSVYFGYCGSRLIIDNTVNKNGAVYPYSLAQDVIVSETQIAR